LSKLTYKKPLLSQIYVSMKINKIALVILLTLFQSGYFQFKLAAQINLNLNSTPTSTEASAGLKEALNLGVKNAVDILSKKNGFLADKDVKIAFPNEIKKVDQTLRSLGLANVSDDFIKQLNAGAEKAVVLAAPILADAIKSMTFNDAMKILTGGEGSATKYFEAKTKDSLYTAFKPKVKEVLDQYGISNSYSSMMSKYNTIPFVSKANTDLNDYVTKETLKGLFIKLVQEENKIRKDAKLQTSPLLQKVFGYANQKSPTK
jgi:hypothetical protein